MINAEEARSKTILGKTKYQKKLYISIVKKINQKIKEATKKGLYKVSCERDHISDDVCKLLITHYENLGYTIRTYNYNSWFQADKIYISWEEETK